MTFKKIIVIFLLILCVFSFFNFSSVHAENINVTSSSAERMKDDIDYLKQLLKKNNINNMNDLASFLGVGNAYLVRYFYIEDAGHTLINLQYSYFYNSLYNVSIGVDNYSYYGIRQNSFTLSFDYALQWSCSGINDLTNVEKSSSQSTFTFTAPTCWFLVKTADLFTMDSSQIVANAVGNVENAVGNVNNSINNLDNTLTEDNSSQDDINLGSHNDEMNTASDKLRYSNLYLKFDNIIEQMYNAFTYNDDEVSTIPISFNNYNYDLRSDTISSFLKNNNLGFVILLWQSILWFSLFYTMFLLVRKLYKAVAGGNPVDDVASTLSNEDNKIVGGF